MTLVFRSISSSGVYFEQVVTAVADGSWSEACVPSVQERSLQNALSRLQLRPPRRVCLIPAMIFMVAVEELEPSKEHSLLITVAKSNFLTSTSDFHEGVFDCPTFWCQVLVVAGKANSSYTLRSLYFRIRIHTLQS